jgi:2-hydroxychromene-2-carboxylate isomerase
MAFREGIDLTARTGVLQAAERAALDASALDRALENQSVKRALREANEDAIAAGVYGVPTFEAGGLLWWGDHQLPAAAAALHGSSNS